MKKILLFGIVLLLLISFVYADAHSSEYQIFDMMDSPTVGYNASFFVWVTATTTNDSLAYEGDASCKLGTGTDNAVKTLANTIDNTTDFTMEFYVYAGTSDTRNPVVYFFNGVPYQAFKLGESAADFGSGSWVKVQAEYYLNGSQKIYKNDVFYKGGNYGTFDSTGNYFSLKNNDAGRNSYIDAFRLWNGTIADDPNLTVPPLTPTIVFSYNNNSYEGDTETIKVIFENYNLTSSSTADLFYNGSYYSGSLNLVNSSYAEFSSSVVSPTIYLNNTNITFLWNYSLIGNNETNYTGSTIYNNQTVGWNLTILPRINITAYDPTTGSYISTFTVTDGVNTFQTTNNDIFFRSSAGIYELSFYADGYANSPKNFTFTTGTFGVDNFTVYKQNSILIKVYDEVTGSEINGNISLTFSSIYEEFNNSTLNNNTFFISDLTTAEYQILVNTSGYGQRTYTVTVGNLTTQTLNVYLASSTSTVTFTVYDYDQTSTVLSDVLSTMYRLIGSEWVAVESKYTDISGKVQFNYVESANYKFYLSKSGYNDNIFYLKPVLFSTYDIKMIRSALINYSQDYDKLSIIYSPYSFDNNNESTFYFLISSPSGILINYGFNLTYPGGVSGSSGSNAIGGQLSTSFNITNATAFDYVTLFYYYETSLSGHRNFTLILPINFEDETGQTFTSNRNKTFNLGIFERILIITLMILIVVGISALLGQILPGLGLALIIYGYTVYIGFIPIWSILPSMLLGIIYLMIKSQ